MRERCRCVSLSSSLSPYAAHGTCPGVLALVQFNLQVRCLTCASLLCVCGWYAADALAVSWTSNHTRCVSSYCCRAFPACQVMTMLPAIGLVWIATRVAVSGLWLALRPSKAAHPLHSELHAALRDVSRFLSLATRSTADETMSYVCDVRCSAGLLPASFTGNVTSGDAGADAPATAPHVDRSSTIAAMGALIAAVTLRTDVPTTAAVRFGRRSSSQSGDG